VGLGALGGVIVTLAAVAIVGLLLLRRVAHPEFRPADHAHIAALAELVSASLVQPGQAATTPSEAEVRAALSLAQQRTKKIVADNNELSPIALEFGDCLTQLQSVLDNPPNMQPLVQEGGNAWRGSINDDDRAFFLGLLGLGVELSKLSETSDRVRTLHARVVACRLRLAEVAGQRAAPEASSDTINWAFEESKFGSPIPNDRLTMKNVAGITMTDVFVVTELTGRRGETFSNCYFTRRWENGQTLIANCSSGSGGRETVNNVARVRCRVIAAERSSRTGELVWK
jgi:hypothetical protein